jgi:hypothetical protein
MIEDGQKSFLNLSKLRSWLKPLLPLTISRLHSKFATVTSIKLAYVTAVIATVAELNLLQNLIRGNVI